MSQISKTSLNNKIINSRIANLIEKIKLDNIYGLKILGAGGGGFVLCCLENKKILSKKFECENFEMDHTGTKIIFK